jgi:hypothetical protein
MNQNLGLELLGAVMQWDSERATQEFAWLQLFSQFKYDDYADFIAGVRFVESLATWLQQFEKTEREAAYRFVRTRLIFFSESQLQHLIELLYPNLIQPLILREVANAVKIPEYLVWSNSGSRRAIEWLRRRCLFFGLSDGARIDVFRRATVGLISNEQVLLAPEISPDKWARLHESLKEDHKKHQEKWKDRNSAEVQPEEPTTFRYIFLLDDFTGTGYTLGQRMLRFWLNVRDVREKLLDPNWAVFVHHYAATDLAKAKIEAKNREQHEKRGEDWYTSVDFSYAIVLSEAEKVSESKDPEFWPLIEKYYDPRIRSSHTDKGGSDDIRLGFGKCALPLILEHNTPNNSIALLWGDTSGGAEIPGIKPMKPLFRRRQRHVEYGSGLE